MTVHDMTLHDMTLHDMTLHDMTLHDMTVHDMTVHDNTVCIWHDRTGRLSFFRRRGGVTAYLIRNHFKLDFGVCYHLTCSAKLQREVFWMFWQKYIFLLPGWELFCKILPMASIAFIGLYRVFRFLWKHCISITGWQFVGLPV